MNHVIILGFSLFLLTGAYFGFKAGSRISLVMGLISSLLIGFGDFLVRVNPRMGTLFLMLVSGLLIVSFVQRVLKTKKMMPAGMLLMVTCLFFIFTLYLLLN